MYSFVLSSLLFHPPRSTDISEAKHAKLAKRAADVTNQRNELLSTETRKRERRGRASEVVGRRKFTPAHDPSAS